MLPIKVRWKSVFLSVVLLVCCNVFLGETFQVKGHCKHHYPKPDEVIFSS